MVYELRCDPRFVRLDPNVRRLIDGPNVVHLATLRADGTPRNSVVWAGLEKQSHVFERRRASRRPTWPGTRNPNVALSVTAADNPYDMATVHGPRRRGARRPKGAISARPSSRGQT